MDGAKKLIVKIINSRMANEFIKKNHYSGRVVQNSALHFGVYYNNVIHGVMQFGSSMNKRFTVELIKNTKRKKYNIKRKTKCADSIIIMRCYSIAKKTVQF